MVWIFTHDNEFVRSPVRKVTIWKSIWSKDIQRKCRDFLWKSIHDAYKIGEAWLSASEKITQPGSSLASVLSVASFDM